MEPVRIHQAKDLRGREYVLRFSGATLTIVPVDGGTPAAISREAFSAGATILDGVLSRRTIMLSSLGRLSLRLTPEAFQALRLWIQPTRRQALARSLRRITVWQLLLGSLFFSTSGPWINEGGTWDVPMAVLGGLAISVGVLSVAWPRRWVYALEMVWSVALSAVVASWVAAGVTSPIWFGVSVLLMIEAYGYGRLFLFWVPVREPAPPADDDDDDAPKSGGSMFDPPDE